MAGWLHGVCVDARNSQGLLMCRYTYLCTRDWIAVSIRTGALTPPATGTSGVVTRLCARLHSTMHMVCQDSE